MSLRRYIVPTIISASVTAAVFLGAELMVRRSRTSTPKPEPAKTEVCIGYPWNDPNSSDLRMMNVVVETTGVFVGEERIAFDAFREYLIQHAQDWRPDHVFVFGTMKSRFGRGVEVGHISVGNLPVRKQPKRGFLKPSRLRV